MKLSKDNLFQRILFPDEDLIASLDVLIDDINDSENINFLVD